MQLDERSHGRTLFLVPLGLKPWFEQQGIRNVIELDWWDSHVHAGVEFHLVPVQHWSQRTTNDRNKTLWGGWAVFAPNLRWYFSGDAGYSRDFTDTRTKGHLRAHGRAAGCAPRDPAVAREAMGVTPEDFSVLKIGETRWLSER